MCKKIPGAGHVDYFRVVLGNDPHSTFEVFEAEQKGALFPSWQ
jgi:hypothetical protein